ncbi:anti-sigma factor [Rhodobacter calidifons]|uniref:Anti-sigma factor n=1 Tax=Rhodobacter calidifons TaxID=2715277 RepID=A0ABX0G7S0_9RHOB|nr:anti-sigma factor [Rhodobacter calidifons]NHB77261.1 anti-sigma factor [Rhodobacter calidifons]
MTDAPLTPMEADDALAAEYVLGVLDLAERAEAEARIKRDPGFAGLVAAWESRMAGLNDDFAEAPAPDLLPKIEARLFPKAAPAPTRRRFGLNLGWLAGAALAAVVVLATVATLAPPRPETLVTLATADRRLSYQVSHFGDTLQVARVAGPAAAPGQVHQLWIIAPGASPVSLGLLEDMPLVIDYPVPPAGFVFAVSVEPEGGSPTGLPTGPVILTAIVGEAT